MRVHTEAEGRADFLDSSERALRCERSCRRQIGHVRRPFAKEKEETKAHDAARKKRRSMPLLLSTRKVAATKLKTERNIWSCQPQSRFSHCLMVNRSQRGGMASAVDPGVSLPVPVWARNRSKPVPQRKTQPTYISDMLLKAEARARPSMRSLGKKMRCSLCCENRSPRLSPPAYHF